MPLAVAGLSVRADSISARRPMGKGCAALHDEGTVSHATHTMNTPAPVSISSIPSRSAGVAGSSARSLVMAVVAYVSAVSASIGAAAALVAAGVPLHILVAVA